MDRTEDKVRTLQKPHLDGSTSKYPFFETLDCREEMKSRDDVREAMVSGGLRNTSDTRDSLGSTDCALSSGDSTPL